MPKMADAETAQKAAELNIQWTLPRELFAGLVAVKTSGIVEESSGHHVRSGRK